MDGPDAGLAAVEDGAAGAAPLSEGGFLGNDRGGYLSLSVSSILGPTKKNRVSSTMGPCRFAGFYIVPDKRRMYGTNFSRYEVKRVKNETLEQEEPQNIHAIPGVRVTHDRISCRPVSYDTLCTRIVLLHQHLGGG